MLVLNDDGAECGGLRCGAQKDDQGGLKGTIALTPTAPPPGR
jgi:hypothetical protein